MSAEGTILIGTCGYSYEEWKRVFYPTSIQSHEMLSYYQQHFSTVEIDSSFYRIPTKRTTSSWLNTSSPNFRFSAKLPQSVTHDALLDLDECEGFLDEYLQNMDILDINNKMLCYLLQLPPKFSYHKHKKRLEEFLKVWNEKRMDFLDKEGINQKKNQKREQRKIPHFHRQLIAEFRNKSWIREETQEILRKYKVGYCVVIEPVLPDTLIVTHPEIAYIRFHGFGKKIWFDYLFSEKDMEEWALKLKTLRTQVPNILVYFNNHFSGKAVKNANQLHAKLGIKKKPPTMGLERYF